MIEVAIQITKLSESITMGFCQDVVGGVLGASRSRRCPCAAQLLERRGLGISAAEDHRSSADAAAPRARRFSATTQRTETAEGETSCPSYPTSWIEETAISPSSV